MNRASLVRLRVAKELASHYARYESVKLAIVGGSVQEKLLRISLALSREYFSTFKWLFHNPELITVAPDDFIPRLRSVFSVPLDAGAEVLHELVHETYDLIERQFPDAKVDWWRSVFDHERTFWEEAPLPIP